MILALVIFAVTYLLMLALPKERPWVALCSAAVFMALGQLGVYEIFRSRRRWGRWITMCC